MKGRLGGVAYRCFNPLQLPLSKGGERRKGRLGGVAAVAIATASTPSGSPLSKGERKIALADNS